MNYDVNDVINVVSVYKHKIELMDYMLENMRDEINVLNKSFDVSKEVLLSVYKCLEVIEQLSNDNVTYSHEDYVKYHQELKKVIK